MIMEESHITRVERPYKEFPLLTDMKIATISHIIAQEEDAAIKPGMYIIVPAHFPNECKVIRATVGYYARLKDSAVEENFYVRPAATVAAANSFYEDTCISGNLPDFKIAIKRNIAEELKELLLTDRAGTPQQNNRHGFPDGKATCVCGRLQLISFSDSAGRYVGPPPWKFRNFDGPDIHLPQGWYCGDDGHYAETYVEMPNATGFYGLRELESEPII
jgi:hypothetical protein